MVTAFPTGTLSIWITGICLQICSWLSEVLVQTLSERWGRTVRKTCRKNSKRWSWRRESAKLPSLTEPWRCSGRTENPSPRFNLPLRSRHHRHRKKATQRQWASAETASCTKLQQRKGRCWPPRPAVGICFPLCDGMQKGTRRFLFFTFLILPCTIPTCCKLWKLGRKDVVPNGRQVLRKESLKKQRTWILKETCAHCWRCDAPWGDRTAPFPTPDPSKSCQTESLKVIPNVQG